MQDMTTCTPPSTTKQQAEVNKHMDEQINHQLIDMEYNNKK